MAECVDSAYGMVPILPICLDLQVITLEMNLIVLWDNTCNVPTDIVRLLQAEEVWLLALA